MRPVTACMDISLNIFINKYNSEEILSIKNVARNRRVTASLSCIDTVSLKIVFGKFRSNQIYIAN